MMNLYNNDLDFLHSNDEIARNLYEAALDMDWMDYEDEKDENINELEAALDWLEAAAKNKYNRNYFKILYLTLQRIYADNK